MFEFNRNSNTNFQIQSFRQMLNKDWDDIRREVFTNAALSYGDIKFLYNPEKVTWRVTSDIWSYKISKHKQLGYLAKEIEEYNTILPNEIYYTIYIDEELSDFLGCRASEEEAKHLTDKMTQYFANEIEKLMLKTSTDVINNIIPFLVKHKILT